MNLLCHLGLHRPAWTPHVRGSREPWLQVRRCLRCGRPMPYRSHR